MQRTQSEYSILLKVQPYFYDLNGRIGGNACKLHPLNIPFRFPVIAIDF